MGQQRLPESKFFLNLTAIVFFAFLWIPSLQMWFSFVPEMASTEKRTLASMPELTSVSIRGLMNFLSSYEKFFDERFGFRNTLVYYNNVLKTKYLKVRQPIPDIVVGNDGWLFYNSAKDGVSLKDYCGTVPYTSSQLSAIESKIEEDCARLRTKGIHYFIVIPPSKHSIYPEHLPENIVRAANLTRLDQVAGHLARHSEVPFIDLRAPLLEAKHDFPVYYKTDTHWNAYGAFIGYREIMKSLSAVFPDCNPQCIQEFELNCRKIPAVGDLAEMLSLKGSLEDIDVMMSSRSPSRWRLSNERMDVPGRKVVLQKFMSETPLSGSKSIMVFHDSFGNSLMSFLAGHFSKSTFVSGDPRAPNELIDVEKPDIVILEVTERYLDALRTPFFVGKP